LIGVTTTGLAQERGTFEVGAFGRYTFLDSSMDHGNAGGFGGRVGLFFMKNLAIEAEGTMSTARAEGTGSVSNIEPLYLRLTLHRAMSENWTAILGAGWVRDQVDPAGPSNFKDDGYSGLVGLQRRIGERASLRFDVVADYIANPYNRTPTNDISKLNVALQAGMSLGRRQGPRDADLDGVVDNMDACPNTIMGEMVDARGCALPKDADKDGVIDANDRCANTPAGTQVDVNGCAVPVDSDRDGVMDHVDKCANTPAGTRVDAEGCPVPVDSDRDGVMDNLDACLNTPAGTRVDGRGCPIPVDTDGDGVMDDVDACPNTARGARADARGCAIVFEEGRTNVVLDGVTFATGSAVLTANARTVLDRVAESLLNARDVNVEIAGHTDNTGSHALNVRLSGQRAESVRTYLAMKGVSATRLTAKGYGPDEPTASNNTADGRLANRRVELKRTN